MLTDRQPPPGLSERDDVAFEAADATDRRAVEAAFGAGLARFGAIDAAVLAAGVEGPVGPIEDITEAVLDRVLAVNVKGSLFWMQVCLREMKTRGQGSIVALSSISGVVGGAYLAPYVLSKHAVVGLVRSAALECGRHNVRVNAVCPGPIDSEMMGRLDRALSELDPSRSREPSELAKGLPQQRYAAPADVAEMVAFLCSDASASCHGGTYMVDGGFTAK